MANNRYRKKRRRKPDNYVPPFEDSVLNQPITDLKFRNENTLSLLQSAGIKTLRDIVKREEKDFYKIFTFKKRNLLDVKGAIKSKKVYLKPTQTQDNQKEETKKDEAGLTKKNNERQKQRSNQRESKKHNENDRTKQNQQRAKRVIPKPPQDKYIKVNKGGKWGFTDRNGKIVIEPLYDEVFNFKEELCCVEKDELFGFINREGEEVIPIVYECALSFNEGFACVFKDGNCGYINKENDIIIDFKYDAGTQVVNKSCRVKKDGKWGELNLDDPTTVRWIN